MFLYACGWVWVIVNCMARRLACAIASSNGRGWSAGGLDSVRLIETPKAALRRMNGCNQTLVTSKLHRAHRFGAYGGNSAALAHKQTCFAAQLAKTPLPHAGVYVPAVRAWSAPI